MARRAWRVVSVLLVASLAATMMLSGGADAKKKKKSFQQKLDDSSLSSHVELGSVATATFGSGQATENAAVFTGEATSICPAGSAPIGGEVSWAEDDVNDEVYIVESRMARGGWYGKGAVDVNQDFTLQVQAICLR